MAQSIINLVIGGKTKRSNTGQHPVSLDWNALPDESQAFVIAYGLKQYLADGMAGKETEADAKAGVEARVAKLLAADFTRTRGEGNAKPDSVEGRALKLARAFIRAKLKSANKTAEKEQVDAAAKKLVETQPKWKVEAKSQLDAEAATNAALAEDESDDILADLLGDDADEEDESTEDE